MAMQETTTIENVSLRCAENGFILNYDMRTKKTGGGTYDNCSYECKTEVYSFEDGSKAIKRMASLAGINIGELEDDD